MGDTKSEFEIIRFKKGETVFKEGEEGNCAYLIRSGVVKIYRMVNNTKLSITHLKAGQIMGEMAVIGSAPRSASAETTEDSELVKIDRKSLNSALGNTLPVIKAMLDQLIYRFRLIDRQSMIRESDKILMCACSVIDLIRNEPEGIEYQKFYAIVKKKFSLTEPVFENILNKLIDQELIVVDGSGNSRKIRSLHSTETVGIKKDAPQNLIECTATPSDDTYIHINDFATMLKTTAKDIITRAGIGYIPIDIFYISKEGAALWAEDIGEEIFNPPQDE